AAKAGCSAQSVLGPEVRLAPSVLAGWRRLVAIAHDAIRPSRPVGNPLGHEAEADELYGLFGAGAVTVHALVLATEGLLEVADGTRIELSQAERHGQFERLALVAEIGRPPESGRGAREPFGRELGQRLGFHLRHDPVQLAEPERSGGATGRLHVLVPDLPLQEPEPGEH